MRIRAVQADSEQTLGRRAGDYWKDSLSGDPAEFSSFRPIVSARHSLLIEAEMDALSLSARDEIAETPVWDERVNALHVW